MEIDTIKDSEKAVYVSTCSTKKPQVPEYMLFFSLTKYPLIGICNSLETATVSEPGTYFYEYEETRLEEAYQLLAIKLK